MYKHFAEGRHTVKRSLSKLSAVWTDLCIEQELMRSAKTQGGLIGREMSESSQNLWTLTVNSTALIYEAITHLTNTKTLEYYENKELGTARIKKDCEDRDAICKWLEIRNPFVTESKNLQSLATGLTSQEGMDGVSCEKQKKSERRYKRLLRTSHLVLVL